MTQFEDVLKKKAVPVSRHVDYKKWLRHYPDFLIIQPLLRHSDVRATMIYTHCVPCWTVKEAKSPLDF